MCRLLHAWVLAVAIHMFIAAEGNRALDYYQMPLVAPAVLLMVKPLARAAEGVSVVGRRFSARGIAALLLALVAAFGYTYSVPLYRGHPYTTYNASQLEIGRQI